MKPLTTEPVTELEIVPLAAVAGVPPARGLVPQLPALQQLQQQAAQQHSSSRCKSKSCSTLQLGHTDFLPQPASQMGAAVSGAGGQLQLATSFPATWHPSQLRQAGGQGMKNLNSFGFNE